MGLFLLQVFLTALHFVLEFTALHWGLFWLKSPQCFVG